MKSVDSIGLLVQQVRQHAHLTQRELAERVGTSQSAIAKLEQGESNPTIDTLERCAAAAGLAVKFTLVPLPVADPVIEQYKGDVDRSLLRENRKKSVHERLQSLGEWQANLNVQHYAVSRGHMRLREDGRGRPAAKPVMTQLERLLTALCDAEVEFIIVGGVAARAHGSSRLTDSLDVAYARSPANLSRIVKALAPYAPYLRSAPSGLPFDWSVATLQAGLNFTLTTTTGAIDLLGEIAGGGQYDALRSHTIAVSAFNRELPLLDLPWLIHVTRAAGRPKDLEVIAELEVLLYESV